MKFQFLLLPLGSLLSFNLLAEAQAYNQANGQQNSKGSDYIETSSNQNSHEQFKDLFTLKNENYIYVSGNMKELWVNVFDEDGNGVFSSSIENPDDVKTCLFHGAKLIQNNITVFFTGKTEEVEKGNVGLFAWTFSFELMDFKDPILIDQFPVTSSEIDFVDIVISRNGEYVGFVIEPKTYCKIYKHNIVVCDTDLKPVYSDKAVDAEFDDCFLYKSVHITNDAHLFLVYEEHAGDYSKPAFQRSSEHAAIMSYSGNGTEKISYFRDSERSILSLCYFEEADEPFFFCSWFYKDESTKEGFSVIEPSSMTETRIHEFDPAVFEPYIETSATDKFNDALKRENQLSDSKVNVFLDLVGTVDYGSESLFIVQKKTPCRIIVGDYSRFANVEGDIFLINADGTFLKKIDRSVVTFGTPRGIYFTANATHLTLYYFSLPADSDEKISPRITLANYSETYRPADRYLFKSIIDFETFEAITTEFYKLDQDNYYITASLKNAIEFGNSLMTIAWANRKYHILDLTIPD